LTNRLLDHSIKELGQIRWLHRNDLHHFVQTIECTLLRVKGLSFRLEKWSSVHLKVKRLSCHLLENSRMGSKTSLWCWLRSLDRNLELFLLLFFLTIAVSNRLLEILN